MSIPSQARTATRQHGLSMIELVVFIVIVSVAVVGVLSILNLTSRRSGDPQMRKQALAIAEALLEEVETARFTYCDPADDNAEIATSTSECAATPEQVGPESGNTTRPFDNVSDYVTAFNTAQHAFDNSGGVLVDAGGNNISVTGTYSATLTVTPEALNGIVSVAGGAGAANMATVNALRLTVTVSYGGESVTLEGYRTRYAPNSTP
jgi:MSHA pilin protein MshD